MRLFPFLPPSTAKISKRYISNKHKKTLEGRQKAADEPGTRDQRHNEVVHSLGFPSASYSSDLEWDSPGTWRCK